jgi:hypothetical protein
LSPRYAPDSLKRALEMRARVNALVKSGTMTQEEANLAVAAVIASGEQPHRVRCPNCHKVWPLVGKGDTFACECSPNVKRSVWDCRA